MATDSTPREFHPASSHKSCQNIYPVLLEPLVMVISVNLRYEQGSEETDRLAFIMKIICDGGRR